MALEDAGVRIILYIMVGTLAAIVYSLRVLVLLERRVANMEMHIETIAEKSLREEYKIEGLLARKKKKRR